MLAGPRRRLASIGGMRLIDVSLIEGLWQDARSAMRSSRSHAGFFAAATLTLGLGIGATIAIFSVVNSVVINPLAYPDSAALVRIVHAIGGVDQPYFNDAIYATYADIGACCSGR